MQALFFDLDGTLTDPFEGITKSIQYALEKMGAKIPPQEDLGFCIGPPLWESFHVLLENDDRAVADKAVHFYRERYTDVGLFENEVYSGIPELLSELQGQDTRLFVCTSKPWVSARRILDHFDLSRFFLNVYGSEEDGTRSHKDELIAHLLEREGLDAERCVMIGDRKHDLIGAKKNSVPAIGVRWGYASNGELEAHEPFAIAEDRAQLRSALFAQLCK